MESTYGNRIRNKDDIFGRKIEKLEKIIDSANSNGGSVIIPAFALDRAQQILTDLYLIYQKKKNETSIPDETDYSWKEIIDNSYSNVKCSQLPNKISTLQGERKDFRKYLSKAIKTICSENHNSSESLFSEVSEKCQNRIAEFLEKKHLQKPSNKIQETINSQYGFTVLSPLIGKVNEIYKSHLTDELYSQKKHKRKFEYISDAFMEKLNISEKENIDKQKDSIKKILQRFLKNDSSKNDKNNEKIVVTASGMCDEGKVTTLLGRYFRDENAVLILTGYQARDTNGFLLKNMLDGKYEENNKKESLKIKLSDEDFTLADIKCRIEDMSEYYSGHADQEQLLEYVTPFYKSINHGEVTVLLNHGTEESRNELKTKIEEKNEKTKVILPEINKWIDIVSLKVSEPDIDMEIIEENVQFNFVQVDDIHLYYPIGYDDEKLQSIVDHIRSL
jgi:Cft2 family RNA processing exonuclease